MLRSGGEQAEERLDDIALEEREPEPPRRAPQVDRRAQRSVAERVERHPPTEAAVAGFERARARRRPAERDDKVRLRARAGERSAVLGAKMRQRQPVSAHLEA